ncbi:MAG TPA: two-component regulator propeller domain-containing protein, partial [Planctomicrobium sp.]|nr:two-component regulator propeller domain-containing protein [Planctomicrobium sp.]
IGTQVGLFLFDGLRFQPCRVTEGIPLDNLWIQDIQESSDGALWIATHGAGLIRYRNEITTTIAPEAELELAALFKLLFDQSGTLWIGADSGLFRYDQKSLVRVDEVSSAIPDVRALAESPDGTIWVGGRGNTLYLRTKSGFVPQMIRALPKEILVTDLLSTSESQLWIGTSQGLVSLTGEQETLFTREDGLADNSVECLESCRTGGIWVGTRDGICRVSWTEQNATGKSDTELEAFRTRDGLSQSTACSLLVDREDSLWVGTKNGLNQFVDRRTIPLTTSEGLGSNDAGPILQDPDGTIWMGTIGSGLGMFDGRRCVMKYTTRDGLPSNHIFSLIPGGNGKKWIGTDQGVCCLDQGQIIHNFTINDGLPSNWVRALAIDDAGRLWIGTDSGLVLWDGKQIVPVDPHELAFSRTVLSLLPKSGLPKSTGKMIIATESGLFESDGSHTQPILSGVDPIPNVDSLVTTDDGRLWMGTRDRGLLVRHPDGTSFQFSMKHGLYDDEIFGVLADQTDRLWLACSRGIFHVQRSELVECAAGNLARVVSQTFSPTDALRTVECQRDVQPVARLMQDGKIWFATNHGILIVDSLMKPRLLGPPNVIVEEIQANGKTVNPGCHSNRLTLSPGPANVTLRYTSTSYVIPIRTEFRYRLEGFDTNWIHAGTRREAFYTNLPPATYRFHAEARQPMGDWAETMTPVLFVVPSHFYETWWFYLFAALLLGIGIWGIFRLRMMQLRAQFQAVMAERLRIARELHDTLLQGFSGITMQMQALSNQLGGAPEQKMLKEVISDAGMCLREARRTVAGLRNAPGNTRLSVAISEAARQATESHDLHLTLKVVDLQYSLPMEVEYHLLRIAQEAISNTIKHASARNLEVCLDVSGR